MSAPTWDGRCPAAHVADPRPCEGQRDAVRIVDQNGASAEACLLHGAVLLASLDRGRVYPLNDAEGSAIAVFTRAQALPAFDFPTGPGVARVTTANEPAAFPSAPEPANETKLVSYTDPTHEFERHAGKSAVHPSRRGPNLAATAGRVNNTGSGRASGR